jgi:hypothetical protein
VSKTTNPTAGTRINSKCTIVGTRQSKEDQTMSSRRKNKEGAVTHLPTTTLASEITRLATGTRNTRLPTCTKTTVCNHKLGYRHKKHKDAWICTITTV